MLNMIGCLDKPSLGKVIVDGKQVDSFNRQQRAAFRGNALGFIFQSFNLFPVLTVYENIEYPLVMIRNEPGAKRKEKILLFWKNPLSQAVENWYGIVHGRF